MTNLQVLISQQQIQEKIEQIAQQIDRDYAGKELTIVMVMKGAIMSFFISTTISLLDIVIDYKERYRGLDGVYILKE